MNRRFGNQRWKFIKENKKIRKQENKKKGKKTKTRPRKWARKKEKLFFLILFVGRVFVFFPFFLFSYFLVFFYKFPPQSCLNQGNCILTPFGWPFSERLRETQCRRGRGGEILNILKKIHTPKHQSITSLRHHCLNLALPSSWQKKSLLNHNDFRIYFMNCPLLAYPFTILRFELILDTMA